MAKLRILLTAAAAVGLLFAAAPHAAKSPSPTLQVTFSTTEAAGTSSVPYGTRYVVWGCGYGSTYVSVVAYSPEAISFTGDTPDSSGCISVSNFSTNAPGTYKVSAFQQLRGSKATEVASTTFTVG